MNENEKAILTVIGKDRVGVIAAVAAAVAEANANILQVSQVVMDEFFTMNMEIDISAMNRTSSQLEQDIKSVLPDFEIRIMHENIFTSMHRI